MLKIFIIHLFLPQYEVLDFYFLIEYDSLNC